LPLVSRGDSLPSSSAESRPVAIDLRTSILSLAHKLCLLAEHANFSPALAYVKQ
jgi:hypothetical protein